eukprot:gene30679-35702_t
MEDIVSQQEKLSLENVRLFSGGQGQAGLAASVCSCPIGGATLSAAEVVESMEDVWYMCRDELCLKMALLSQINYSTGQDEFSRIQTIFSALGAFGELQAV